MDDRGKMTLIEPRRRKLEMQTSGKLVKHTKLYSDLFKASNRAPLIASGVLAGSTLIFASAVLNCEVFFDKVVYSIDNGTKGGISKRINTPK